MGGGGPGGKWPRRYQAEDGDISSEKSRTGRTDNKIEEYFLRGWYDSLSDVGEIRVYQRADFQSCSRVLKKVF